MSPRLRPWLAAICLLVCPAARYCFASLPEDAIVRITSTRHDLRTSVGTGSLISSDGKILTCYHVIKDSQEIDVVHKSQHLPYKSVRILSIFPEYDLAVLQIDGFPMGQPFLSLDLGNVPPSAVPQQAKSWGYPDTVSFSLRPIHISSIDPGWTKAKKLTIKSGADLTSIFQNIDLDLITLQADINSGCSGAPILSNGSIIGIIEGSWTVEGLVDAWAIPAKYYSQGDQDPRAKKPNLPASKIPTWPPLSLTNEGSALGRSEIGLTIPVVIALGQYGDSFDGVTEKCLPLEKQVPMLEDYLKQQLTKADEAATTRNSSFVVSNDKSLHDSLKSNEMMQYAQGVIPCLIAWDILYADGKQLNTAVEGYLGDVSHVEHDPSKFNEIRERVSIISNLLVKQDNADKLFIYPYRIKDDWTLADYQSAFKQDLSILSDDETNPAKMLDKLVVELNEYNSTVNKLIYSHP